MDYILGSIVYVPWSRPMEGFAQCRGQILDVQHNQALFSLLGTRFGGDGISNFALPDLRPWADAGPDYGKRTRRDWHDDEMVPYICLNGYYPAWD